MITNPTTTAPAEGPALPQAGGPALPQAGGPAIAPPGLKGLIVADTTLGDVRGAEGFYHYGPYSAVDLARLRPFEDVWRLFVDGSLPDAAQRAAFASEVAPLRPMPAGLSDALPGIATSTDDPLLALRTAVSWASADAGLRPLLDLGRPERRADALRLAALAPTVLAAIHRRARGAEPIAPRADLGAAANLLWMVTGEEPDPEAADALGCYLVSTIDHGFNASTFTARVIASTGADLGSCVVGAVGALSGPLHGGAPSRALDLLDEIGDPARVEAVVAPRLAAGERIMGFGHAVYQGEDPRAVMLRELAGSLGGDLAERAAACEDGIVALLEAHRPGRHLRANVEYWAGVVMATVGLPRSMFTPTFASSRIVGWCAHALEQADDPRIIRPSSRYRGEVAPRPVPAMA